MSAVSDWILEKVGKKRQPVHKLVDEEDAPNAGLFKEINALRSPGADDVDDEEAAERAKYSDNALGRIANSKVFEFSTLGVICLNALMIGFDTNYTAAYGKADNLLEGPIGFIIIENVFCTYFTVEVLIRFFALKSKCFYFYDRWLMFDSVLVTMMVVETWILPYLGGGGALSQLSIFRLLRLVKITRLSRLMRAVPQLMVIIKGMVAATRTVVCTGALMFLVLYTFSIIFTDFYHEVPNQDGLSEAATQAQADFGDMGRSMFTLFIMGTVLDDYTYATVVIRDEAKDNGNAFPTMMIPFVIFTVISSFMMLNMLVGILVEVVEATGEGEDRKNIETNVREAIATIFASMDKDSNREISRGEFLSMKNQSHVMEALEALDIMSEHFNLYAELFFKPEEGTNEYPSLSYDKLVSMIFRLRPGGFVSSLDFAAFTKKIHSIHDKIKERVKQLEQTCKELSTQAENGVPILLAGPAGTANGSHLTTLSVDDRDRLQRTESNDILEELIRRLGAENLDLTGAALMEVPNVLDKPASSPTDTRLPMTDVKPQEQTVAVPAAIQQPEQALVELHVPDDNDSDTVYV
jgi:voltage-gated sodium channel